VTGATPTNIACQGFRRRKGVSTKRLRNAASTSAEKEEAVEERLGNQYLNRDFNTKKFNTNDPGEMKTDMR